MTKPTLDTEATAEYKKWLRRADHATRDAVSDKVSEYLAAGTVDDFTRRKSVHHLGKGLLEMKLRGIRVYFAIEQGMLAHLYHRDRRFGTNSGFFRSLAIASR